MSGQNSSSSNQVQRQTQNQNSNEFNYAQNLIPTNFQQVLNEGLGTLLGGIQGTPSIAQLFQNVPLLGTAPINRQQRTDINALQGQTGPNGATTSALAGLNALGQSGADLSQPNAALASFLGTQGTPSAATKAAQKEFNDLIAPEIMQQSSLAGLGNSGAALNAIANANEQALVPLLQSDEANTLSAAGQLSGNQLSNAQLRQGALGQLGSLGQNQQTLTQNALENALTAAGLKQQTAQQLANALYNKQQQGFQLAEQTQQSPQQWFQDLVNVLTHNNTYSQGSSFSVGQGSQSQNQPLF